jgi:hypothetical protein
MLVRSMVPRCCRIGTRGDTILLNGIPMRVDEATYVRADGC